MKLILIGFTWIIFFALHSLGATDTFKERVRGCLSCPALARRASLAYRLYYNLFALITLTIPLGLVLSWRGPDLYAPSGFYAPLDRLIQLVAICGFLWALRSYNLEELSGYRQWRHRHSSAGEAPVATLRTGGPLRFSRHPVYFFGLILVWSGAQNAATLLTAILISVYIAIGIQIEERRLVAQYGETYLTYKQHVPVLVPLPWRYLRRPPTTDKVG